MLRSAGAVRFLAAVVSHVLILPMALAGHPADAQAVTETIIFAGSGANLPITRILARAFEKSRPDIRIEIPESIGSTGGIKAAADGAVAIGLSGRPLRENEKKFGLTVVPYARTIIVVGAHPSVADDALSYQELADIYKGRKTKWKDGREIIVLSRDEGEASIDVMRRVIPGFLEAHDESLHAKRWVVAFTDADMNKLLESTPGAIGISDSGAIQSEHLKIKALKLNGIAPLPDNVLQGTYALVKTLSFVFRKEGISEEARAFIDFTGSGSGRRIIEANGYLTGE